MVTGRPAVWWAPMNEVTASPTLPLPEYVTSCSSRNRSRGCSSLSNRRLRDSSPTSPPSTLRVFTLLLNLRSLCHSVVRSTSLCPLAIYSVSENEMHDRREYLANALRICATDDTSQSKCQPWTFSIRYISNSTVPRSIFWMNECLPSCIRVDCLLRSETGEYVEVKMRVAWRSQIMTV